ncbi:restriction endonuclease [Campylobacter sp. JMF_02 ED1]|uniref:restriction endonuclease n=1 Tax=unclassified Campylobacter TaxID=2593542 RepID=UPI0022E9B154|nr:MULTISPECIES: restriction endonuclease [unclassified Campylobacter]MDA3049496.1 restriction endonuclease [Campylobacter sp. JMF_15 NE4]MDA3051077.1 restriction endonuclease [Campylobacter sp. JMF_02 ED1]
MQEIIKKINDLKTQIEHKSKKIPKIKNFLCPCIHGIKYAQMRPYLCEQCALEYIANCEKLNLPYNHNIYEAYYQKFKNIQEKERINKLQKILDDYENPKYNLSNSEIGKRYERYIGYLYEWIYTEYGEWYEVEYHGIRKGVDDGGVDLFVKKGKNEILLIQCKWWAKDKVMHDNVVARIGFAKTDYEKDNPNKKITAMIVSANENLDDKSRQLCKKHNIVIQEVPYDKSYPKIKCNINNRGKIYHLPNSPSYDAIKITRSKGEYYVKTIQEAEALGFRHEVATKPK